jgi:hypothetical protein
MPDKNAAARVELALIPVESTPRAREIASHRKRLAVHRADVVTLSVHFATSGVRSTALRVRFPWVRRASTARHVESPYIRRKEAPTHLRSTLYRFGTTTV